MEDGKAMRIGESGEDQLYSVLLTFISSATFSDMLSSSLICE